MVQLLSIKPDQHQHRFGVVYCGLALFINLSVVQIQASPSMRCPDRAGMAQEDRPVRQLELGKSIEREVAGGQSHAYQVALADGQYVSLVVAQRGIDVVVKLFGPDGKPIMEFDSESRVQGQESVSLVAEAAGSYRLSVQPKLNRAAPGRYEIRIKELRAATNDDRALYEARMLYEKHLELQSAGKYDESLQLVNRALEIRKKLLGPDHHDVAAAILGLATLYREKGEYAKAEPLYQRALTTLENALGPRHTEVAVALHNLGILHFYKGEYAEAESLHNQALAIREEGLGPEHPLVATSLNSLATVYIAKGDYVGAEPLLNRALNIREKVLGLEHPLVAHPLGNLALLYYLRGDYAKAEPLFNRALVIEEKALGPEHPAFADSVHNLGIFYGKKGEDAKAISLLNRALAIREKVLSPEHPEVAGTLDALANRYKDRGEYAEAEPLYQRSLNIEEKVLGPEHPKVAGTLNNLAELYGNRSDYAKAEPLYQRALAIFEKVLGPEHPYLAEIYNNLARLYAAKGVIAQAIAFQSRANAVNERNLALNLATGSERQKLAYLALYSKETDFTLWLHSRAAPNDPQAQALAVTTLLRRKGRGLDAMTDPVGTLRRRAAPQDQQLFDQLTRARSQLAMYTLKGADTAEPDTYRARLKTLEEKVEELESVLSSRNAEFRARTQPVTLAAVEAAIPAGGALVEFAAYTERNLQTGKSKPPRYLVYLLSAQGPPKWADLGEVAPIDRAIEEWRRALRGRPDVKRLGREIDEKVMRPVRALLGEIAGETRHLLIAPDGLLNLVPFAALVDEQNRYLVERYMISYLTSGRDLLRTPIPRPNKNAALIVANPAYGRAADIAAPAAENSENSRADKQSGDQSQVNIRSIPIVFQPLPNTEGEAVAIKTVLPEAKVLLWRKATETAIKQARAPRILHIATHGFFLSNSETLLAEAPGGFGEDPLRMSDLQLSGWTAHIKAPLLRSGLALAGANLSNSGDDDGILTALEVAGLDLWGTDLVVLSACDTGVGEITNGDGVDGLRRALVLAGSETQVMSLWPVSDRVTRELMVAYYNGMTKGQGRGEALRRVQLQMLKNVKRWHPFYWAAFIQSGEWANLEGRR